MFLSSKDIPDIHRLINEPDLGGIGKVKHAEASLSVLLFLAVSHRALNVAGHTASAKRIADLSIPGLATAIRCLAESRSKPSPNPFGSPTFEVFRIASERDVSSTSWLLFLDRFRRSGASKRQSQMFDSVSSVIGEMGDNVVGHAFKSPTTPCPAIAGFHVVNGTASFCVTDAGQGFLQSLRRAPKWQHLQNDHEALEAVVLKRATSRPHEQEGGGFKLLFSRMLDFNGMVVLRTGQTTFQLSCDGNLGATRDYRATHSIKTLGSSVSAVFNPTEKPTETKISKKDLDSFT